MRYDVTYWVEGEERTDRLDAPDAASAAAVVQEAYGRAEGLFELISVNLLDDMPTSADAAGSMADAPDESAG